MGKNAANPTIDPWQIKKLGSMQKAKNFQNRYSARPTSSDHHGVKPNFLTGSSRPFEMRYESFKIWILGLFIGSTPDHGVDIEKMDIIHFISLLRDIPWS